MDKEIIIGSLCIIGILSALFAIHWLLIKEYGEYAKYIYLTIDFLLLIYILLKINNEEKNE